MKNKTLSRRAFSKSGATVMVAALMALGATGTAIAQSAATDLESRFLMELLLDVGPQLDAGHTRIAPVTGGTFGGPRLQGTVHDGGAIIYMTYKGMVVPGDGGLYWRVTPLFTTSSEQYDWLNHRVFVGKSKQVEGKVAYDIFEIL